MIIIGLCSYSCLTDEKKKFIFNPIFKLLKNYGEYEIINISTEEEINNFINKKLLFDYVITFSFYANDNKYIGNHRVKINDLNYKNIIYIESPSIKDILNIPNNQLRYSLNNIYVHCQENKINKEYVEIQKKRIKISKIEDYKKDGYILLLLQSPHQYFLSMDLKEYENFINKIINKIRKFSNEKIIIRYKPKCPFVLNIIDHQNNFVISKKSLEEDCLKSKYCIAHSTNAVFFCFIKGLHMFSLSEYNICHEVSDHNLEKLTNPTVFSFEEKNKYLEKMLNSSFTMEEKFFINLLK